MDWAVADWGWAEAEAADWGWAEAEAADWGWAAAGFLEAEERRVTSKSEWMQWGWTEPDTRSGNTVCCRML